MKQICSNFACLQLSEACICRPLLLKSAQNLMFVFFQFEIAHKHYFEALSDICFYCWCFVWTTLAASQRSLHNEPIFRLLLKVAVKGTQQCDFLNFCGVYSPITCMTFFCTAICIYLHLLCGILCKTIASLLCTLLSQSSCTTCNCEQKSEM